MIEYYLNLTEQCISLTYWKNTHKNMLSTLATMKHKLKNLKGVR